MQIAKLAVDLYLPFAIYYVYIYSSLNILPFQGFGFGLVFTQDFVPCWYIMPFQGYEDELPV
jgi:hypothetical protein